MLIFVFFFCKIIVEILHIDWHGYNLYSINRFVSSIFKGYLDHFSAQARKIKNIRSERISDIFSKKIIFSFISGNTTF